MPAVAFDLDEIRTRTKNIQGVGAPLPSQPLLPPVKTPSGLSSISSLDQSDQEVHVPQHRPILSAPQKNIMYSLIKAHNETERLANKSTDLFNVQVTQSLGEIDKLTTERQEAIRKEAEAAKSRDTWSTLSTVAQYVAGAGAVAFGVAIGGLPGFCIAGAGFAGTVNRLAQDTQFIAWYTKSEELQQIIKQKIEMSAFCLEMGLGLAGGLWAWQAGAFAAARGASAVEMVRKASSIISGASVVAGAGSKIGQQFYNKRSSDLTARMKELESEITTAGQNLTQETTRMRKELEAGDSEVEQIRKAIQNLEVSQD